VKKRLGRLQFQASLGKKKKKKKRLADPFSTKSWECGVIPATHRSTNRRIMRPYLKYNQSKVAVGVAQVVELMSLKP
jgi:hypothetical protein